MALLSGISGGSILATLSLSFLQEMTVSCTWIIQKAWSLPEATDLAMLNSPERKNTVHDNYRVAVRIAYKVKPVITWISLEKDSDENVWGQKESVLVLGQDLKRHCRLLLTPLVLFPSIMRRTCPEQFLVPKSGDVRSKAKPSPQPKARSSWTQRSPSHPQDWEVRNECLLLWVTEVWSHLWLSLIAY